MKNFKTIIATLLLTISTILLVACGQSTKDRVTGVYVATDGQTISLQKDGKVEYSDPKHDDASFGTWKIEDNKVLVDRTTASGTKRKQIFAEIPKGNIESLYFSVVEGSEGKGTFYDQIFTKQ
ncbi:TPA: hypothetical protein ACHVDI_002199 [Streptococcus suis]|nr:hypothetical protein [Streptococcus suis]HEM2704731.1 hypothetical protein [Streptococcus suis]HEM4362361.1 hypothetical protein [Streptococcus suis]HEM4362456.1 hypothetical protein [Streptococcus suis]HEM4478227.1 hypothetical protein [Streptococcus suis]